MSVGNVAEWVQEAKTDYQSALDLARWRKAPTPKAVCWHCQECAEKYLKAFLVLHSKSFPFRHDLMELVTYCLDVDNEFNTIVEPLDELDQYGPDIRYPGTSATVEDANVAVAAMKQVLQLVRRKLDM